MAELVDAHDSGSCEGNLVEVRVFSSAPLFVGVFFWGIFTFFQEDQSILKEIALLKKLSITDKNVVDSKFKSLILCF